MDTLVFVAALQWNVYKLLFVGSLSFFRSLHLSLHRLSLPQPWCGLRDEELSQQSGIAGCIFVHASGFIGGNDTYEGTLEMAAQTLAKNGQ